MLGTPSGQPIQATVTDKTDTAITFDMNHEMAGKALNFEIELLEAK
jgi:FKBP-type peptidyl-prolyl cis-trans isomerase 2